MKRTLSLILVAIMLLTATFAFASCGASEEFVVGITYFAPMNYMDDSGNLIGFETEFAQAVAKEIGMEIRFQEIDWDAKFTELDSGNIDCIWNGMTIDDDRRAAAGISTPYMKNKQVLVVKADKASSFNADTPLTADITIVAETKSAGESVIAADDYLNDATYTAVKDMTTALMEVAGGTADACVIDYVTALGSIGEGTDYTNLVVVESMSFGEEEQYGIAFRKTDTELLAKVNAAIEKLAEDGTIRRIAEKYKLEDYILVG